LAESGYSPGHNSCLILFRYAPESGDTPCHLLHLPQPKSAKWISNLTETRTYPQRARERITGSKVLTRLIDHVEGKIELSNSQVNAARILLAKVLPDMKSVEVDVHAQLKTIPTHRLTDEQLMAIAAQGLPKVLEGKAERVQEPLKLARKSNGAG
jgi:hypothetical protein